MTDKEKPQQEEKIKPAVKKATKKKASTKKRTTAKKAVKKKPAPKKLATKQPTPTPAPAAANDAPPPSTTRVEVVVERPVQQTSPAARHIWWRAALMVAVVVLLFVTIRNTVHNDPAIADKTMAPNPWGEASPSIEMSQPHPWELAPAPQAGDLGAQAPYYTPRPQQPLPRLEPWQAPSDTAPTFYPPPPGPYGNTSSANETAPYPR
jgi:DnaK suppressor protein